ncbi:MAG: glutamate 5-kinase [Armatimonadota bacterium]
MPRWFGGSAVAPEQVAFRGTIVVKLGTSTLTAGSAGLSRPRMVDLARQVAVLRDRGMRVVLVSSGAVAAGREVFGPREWARDLPVKQMLASVGQAHLMRLWSDLFGLFDIKVGQVLLTRAELATRSGYLNARDTCTSLLDHGIVPIVNENDTVATDEIRVGDNDMLSALVSHLVDADRLVLLTDLPGLYTADPRQDPAATLISEVESIDALSPDLAGGSVSGVGTGGMRTKVAAARLAGQGGVGTVIADGAEPEVLVRMASGERIGTWFPAPTSRKESRKRWILSESPAGEVFVDAGAARRLREGGASLLPVGVTGVSGSFDRGSIVGIVAEGSRVAVGISAYGADEVAALAGARSGEIAGRLGYAAGDVVVHRDDLVVL